VPFFAGGARLRREEVGVFVGGEGVAFEAVQLVVFVQRADAKQAVAGSVGPRGA
jgi:hypothetical protein